MKFRSRSLSSLPSRLLALGLGLGLAAGQAAETAAPAPEPVHIRFDWPAGLTAQVRSEKFKSQSTDGGTPSTQTLGMRYTMQTARQGADLIVSYGQPELDPGPLAAMPEEQRRLLTVLTQAAMASYRVSPQGDFLALEGHEAFTAALRRMFDTLLPDGPARQRGQAAIEQLSSAATLSALAKGEWDWMVGAWSGAEQGFDLGDEYAYKSAVELPLPGMGTVETQVQFIFKRRLPCERGGVTRECVELIAVSEPDAAQTAAAIAGFVQRLAPEAAAALRIDGLASDTVLELITETATLLPHRFQLRKAIELTMTERDRPTRREQLERSTYEFSYSADRAGP